MKTLFVLLVLLIAGSWAWKKYGGVERLDRMSKGDVSVTAKTRVDTILKGMRDEGGTLGTAFQTSVCQWDRGVILIPDMSDLERALDRFNSWSAEKGMASRKISGYDVLDATCDPSGAACVVNVKIEGARYKMKVPAGGRISWAQ